MGTLAAGTRGRLVEPLRPSRSRAVFSSGKRPSSGRLAHGASPSLGRSGAGGSPVATGASPGPGPGLCGSPAPNRRGCPGSGPRLAPAADAAGRPLPPADGVGRSDGTARVAVCPGCSPSTGGRNAAGSPGRPERLAHLSHTAPGTASGGAVEDWHPVATEDRSRTGNRRGPQPAQGGVARPERSGDGFHGGLGFPIIPALRRGPGRTAPAIRPGPGEPPPRPAPLPCRCAAPTGQPKG